MTPDRTLIYDGDCGFCRTWVGYWKTRTGDSVRYLSIAEAREHYPGLPPEQLAKRVHLITPEGTFQGAEAVFRSLNQTFALALYRRLPGFAAITESIYELIAGHRNAAAAATRALWGDRVLPPDYGTASVIFTRLLAFIYVIAFASAGTQVRGLFGAEGILPMTPFLAAVHNQLGAAAFWRLPTLFWYGSSDFALLALCWSGVALAAISIIAKPYGKWQRLIFTVLFLYYLSLVSAGQIFMGYQWDFLLLETGFLAIFIKPQRSRIWLFHLLLFRLLFESGAVKLLSGDPTWHNLTALNFHFQTQPLPTVLAWYAQQLPVWFLKACTIGMFAIELIAPFLIFGPRRLKQVAAFAIATLQILILLTGNYTFFNWLTLALCVLLFDNAFWRRWFAAPAISFRPAHPSATAVLTAFIVAMSCLGLAGLFVKLPNQLAAVEGFQSSFGIVNRYGLFAVMTTSRTEIQIEGSLDGEHWLPLKFRYKPGRTADAPRWVAPFQPRLDWQMWFAALAPARQSPWLIPFLLRILDGAKPVVALMDPAGPFGPNPPKLVRATLWEYRFTSFQERSQSGDYWKRELKGLYFPPAGLRGRPAPVPNAAPSR